MNILSLGIRANKAPEETIKECVGAFNKARESINILGGNLGSDFYHDSRILESLKQAAGKGVAVRIAAENPNLPRDKGKGIYSIDNVEVWQLKKPAERHQMSIDGNIARIEKKHGAESFVHPAIICHNVPLVARKIDKYFDEAKKTQIK